MKLSVNHTVFRQSLKGLWNSFHVNESESETNTVADSEADCNNETVTMRLVTKNVKREKGVVS